MIRSQSPDALEVEGARAARPSQALPPGTGRALRGAGSPARPAERLRWFQTLASAGKPGPLDYGVYLTEYRDVFRLAGPQPLVLGALRVLGAVGRLLGKRA